MTEKEHFLINNLNFLLTHFKARRVCPPSQDQESKRGGRAYKRPLYVSLGPGLELKCLPWPLSNVTGTGLTRICHSH